MNHGTRGEREMQALLDSQVRAGRFYEHQMDDRLSDSMIEFIRRQEMMFVATADADGNCDCSPRFGKAGFVLVLDDNTLAYPEYRGNGVFASLGNIRENPHVGLVFVDFFDTTVGLHVNGAANSYPSTEIPSTLASYLDSESFLVDSPIECWVVITVEEAYIHCSKHVPLLVKEGKQIQWGTDDPVAKSNDFFQQSQSPTSPT